MTRQQKLSELPIAQKAATSLNEFRSREAAQKVKLGTLQAEIAGLEQRLEAPLADDNTETLTKVDDRLRQARVLLAIARRDCEAAAAARSAAETEIRAATELRRRQDLEARLEEMVRVMPASYRRLAEELLALVDQAHKLDQEIAEFNKGRAEGVERLGTFEENVRRTTDGSRHIIPAPLASCFEIPALQRGDDDYRVAGSRRPWGFWMDANGRHHQTSLV